MQAPSPSTITLLILLPLLAWRACARFGRMVGKQRLSRVRPWIQLTIFPLLIALLALATLTHPERLFMLATGLAVGAALGVFGLSKTVLGPTRAGSACAWTGAPSTGAKSATSLS